MTNHQHLTIERAVCLSLPPFPTKSAHGYIARVADHIGQPRLATTPSSFGLGSTFFSAWMITAPPSRDLPVRFAPGDRICGRG